MLTLDKIYHAAFILKDVARRTDLIAAPRLSETSELYLKTENLQVTGSFKVRGAYYKISQLSPEERAKGVIACSGGQPRPGRGTGRYPDGTAQRGLHARRRAHHEGGEHQTSGR